MQIPWDALIKAAMQDFASGCWSQYLALPFPEVKLTRLQCPAWAGVPSEMGISGAAQAGADILSLHGWGLAGKYDN